MMRPLYIAYAVYLLGLELGCGLTGFFLMRRSWKPWYRLLVVLCCVTFPVEVTGTWFQSHAIPNFGLYNIWGPLEAFTVIYILSREAVYAWTKRMTRILLIALPAGVLACFILGPGMLRGNKIADLVELFTELLAACAILVDMLQDVSDRLLFTRPMFWMAVGILSYCCIFTVIASVEGLGVRGGIGFEYFMIFSVAANTFMYGGIIACFVMLRREDRTLAKIPVTR
jgi:hypothetical protein